MEAEHGGDEVEERRLVGEFGVAEEARAQRERIEAAASEIEDLIALYVADRAQGLDLLHEAEGAAVGE